jgi:hypothetical protein
MPTCAATVPSEGQSSDRRSDGILKRYYLRLQDMSQKQLVIEVHKYNRRIVYYNDYLSTIMKAKSKVIAKLGATGTKEYLIKSLVNVADQLMRIDLSSTSSTENLKSVSERIWDDDSSSECSGNDSNPLNEEAKSVSDEPMLEDDEDMIEFSDSDDDDDSSSDCASNPPSSVTTKPTSKNLSIIDTLKLYFGFGSFRTGQEWAIQRCLEGKRSLFVSATGHGKSLCFTLPSLLLPGITIVVSPLISLMDDQSKKFPPELPAIVLRGNMSTYEAREIVSQIVQQEVKVIFTSPERLCTASFRNLLGLLQASSSNPQGGSASKDGAVVSLLCIDEAHCMSQWSYNFRPAFLSIRKAIDWIKPFAVLALTATAAPAVQSEIAEYLGIDSAGMHATSCGRANLILKAMSVRDEDDKYRVSFICSTLSKLSFLIP